MEKICQDYRIVETVLSVLDRGDTRFTSLDTLSTATGVGVDAIQGAFFHWAGIKPQELFPFATRDYAQNLRRQAAQTGNTKKLSLHTPVLNFKKIPSLGSRLRGQGINIRYGLFPSPFGRCLLGIAEQGICFLRFVVNEATEETLIRDLQLEWNGAVLAFDPKPGQELLDRVFPSVETVVKSQPCFQPYPIPIYTEGTDFQISVWKELPLIPLGYAITYEELANRIGRLKAARAVGSAVGANCIPYLMPCHRILPKKGGFGNYGEGPLRKRAILAWEGILRQKIEAFGSLNCFR